MSGRRGTNRGFGWCSLDARGMLTGGSSGGEPRRRRRDPKEEGVSCGAFLAWVFGGFGRGERGELIGHGLGRGGDAGSRSREDRGVGRALRVLRCGVPCGRGKKEVGPARQ